MFWPRIRQVDSAENANLLCFGASVRAVCDLKLDALTLDQRHALTRFTRHLGVVHEEIAAVERSHTIVGLDEAEPLVVEPLHHGTVHGHTS